MARFLARVAPLSGIRRTVIAPRPDDYHHDGLLGKASALTVIGPAPATMLTYEAQGPAAAAGRLVPA